MSTAPMPNPFERVRQEVDRWVEAARVTGERALDAVGLASDQRPLPPSADLLETETDLHLVVDLPGVSADGVELSLAGQVLALTATRPGSPFGPDGVKHHLRERAATRFERSFPLPAAVDQESIRAVVRDGLLHVALRKNPATQARSIPIQRSGDQS